MHYFYVSFCYSLGPSCVARVLSIEWRDVLKVRARNLLRTSDIRGAKYHLGNVWVPVLKGQRGKGGLVCIVLAIFAPSGSQFCSSYIVRTFLVGSGHRLVFLSNFGHNVRPVPDLCKFSFCNVPSTSSIYFPIDRRFHLHGIINYRGIRVL